MRTASLTLEVTEADTAASLGSGDLPVLGTPRLLAWAEQATCQVAGDLLGPGQTSVGTRVQLEHLLACAVGTVVRVRADLAHRDGRLLEFDVTATNDSGRLLATGRVRRVVVDVERFLARIPT